jgi:hypothetical protein
MRKWYWIKLIAWISICLITIALWWFIINTLISVFGK